MAATSREPSRAATETATLGGGCFWCLEPLFGELEGVREVVAGYAGGTEPDPSYERVCTGTTGHAEVVRITFDPDVIPFDELLEVFFTVHDPTTPNRQGADVGTQYRSIILFHDTKQRETAERVLREVSGAGVWDRPLVTEIAPLRDFYPAEGYHQGYYGNNPAQPYCRVVIDPKVAEFRRRHRSRLKHRAGKGGG